MNLGEGDMNTLYYSYNFSVILKLCQNKVKKKKATPIWSSHIVGTLITGLQWNLVFKILT